MFLRLDVEGEDGLWEWCACYGPKTYVDVLGASWGCLFSRNYAGDTREDAGFACRAQLALVV